MFKYILVATLLVTVLSAPLETSTSDSSTVTNTEENPSSHIQKIRRNNSNDPQQLTRPSPINPNIPMEPKPEERITSADGVVPSSTEENEDRPPLIHAYEKSTNDENDKSSSSDDHKVNKREVTKAEEREKQDESTGKKHEPITNWQPTISTSPEGNTHSGQVEIVEGKSAVSSNTPQQASVPITLGEPTIAQAPPGYKHEMQSTKEGESHKVNKREATKVEEKENQKQLTGEKYEPITLGEQTIAKAPKGYKHVRDVNAESKVEAVRGKSTVAANTPQQTPVPITLGEPTIAQAPSGYKHVKRSAEEQSQFETSHHIPAHVQKEQKHEEIDNPAVHIEENQESTISSSNESKPKESDVVPLNNPTIASPVIGETKLEKAKTLTPEEHHDSGSSEVKDDPTKREASEKKIVAKSVDDDNREPQYVHPVPVDQIIKNSRAAPEIHAHDSHHDNDHESEKQIESDDNKPAVHKYKKSS